MEMIATPESHSLAKRLTESSLMAAGYAYLVGDAALFASGAMAGRYKEASSGLIWGIGGLVCARYGNPKAEQQLKRLNRKLGDYLRQQHIPIPEGADRELLAHPGGAIEKIESFLYAYPSQILNAGYAAGGMQLVRSGLQHRKGWDATSGALITAGALGGLLIPEKKLDPERPPQGILEKIQEKPLRLSGALYALNNVTLTLSAVKEMRTNPAQKSYLFKYLTAASYIFGNAMLAISSKTHASEGADAEAMEKLAATAARVIAAQAPPLREALVAQISGVLAAEPQSHMKAKEITALLHRKLQAQGTGRSL